jgi:lysozyme
LRMGVNNLTYSKNGLHLTELFERDILTAYKDQRGLWTIGYGHTTGVHAGMTITKEQAEAFLASDIRTAADCVNQVVRVKLTQPQFDSLVDFALNVGITSFRLSTLLREVNGGRFPEAVAQFNLWDHCGGIVNAGLLRRRKAEAAEFSETLPLDTPPNSSVA